MNAILQQYMSFDWSIYVIFSVFVYYAESPLINEYWFSRCDRIQIQILSCGY